MTKANADLLQAIERMIEEKLEAKLAPVKKALRDLRGDYAVLKIDLETVKGELIELKDELTEIKSEQQKHTEAITSLQKDVNTAIRFFDQENVRLGTRVNRIEDHLGLPPITER